MSAERALPSDRDASREAWLFGGKTSERHDGIRQTRPHRPQSLADLPRLHELRRARARHPPLDARRGSRAGPFIKRALEAGINFFDTANVYSDGTSEEIVGRALKDFARRDEVVIATKVNGRMRPGPNGAGLSRKAIMTEIDASLRRLGTDYVDLYQIHRWDYETPIEETLEALHDVVKAGKARYIGASSMYAWQFAQGAAIWPSATAGRGSSRCRTTTTCSIARRSARCCRSARPRASA